MAMTLEKDGDCDFNDNVEQFVEIIASSTRERGREICSITSLQTRSESKKRP